MHESLLSSEERRLSKEEKNFFIVNPDLRDLNYSKYYKVGDKKNFFNESYSSNQKRLLNIEETINLLKISKVLI